MSEQWTLIIKPKKGIFDFNLKEVWQYKDLIYLLVKRDFVVQFKQTVLGPLWFIIQPLITTVLFTIIFGKIAKLSTDGLPHILFYLSGVVAWNYFSSVLKTTSKTFVSNANIFSKVYFPRIIIPISTIISKLMQFAVQFFILIGFMIYYIIKGVDIPVTWNLLWIPVLIVLMAGLSLGMGIILSAMTTKYRDLIFLIDFGVQLLMYITPVIYPLSQIPKKYELLILANPLTPIIETFRYALLGKGTFDIMHLAYSFVFTVVILFVGIAIFNRVEKTFIDTV